MWDENGVYFRCGRCAEICPKQAIRLRTGSA
ncbi:4Fe-4S binding protein [Gemmiger sp.]